MPRAPAPAPPPPPVPAPPPGSSKSTCLVSFIPIAAPAADSPAAPPQSTVDVPLNATTIQLEGVVNALLGNQDKVPYAFYTAASSEAGLVEITGSLEECIAQLGLSTETALAVRYQPLALFKVNPVTRCTDSLPGHTEAVLHVQFSPDGSRLASGGGDTMVRFWDIHTCTPLFVCKGHKNHVLCTAWSPDGLVFISGDREGVIRAWDPATGQDKLRPLVGHRKWITSLSWEPLHRSRTDCATRFASASKDATCKIWNIRSARCEATLTHHTDSVEAVVWGGEGLLYTASRDRTIVAWFEDVADGGFKIARVLTGHAHRVNALALSNAFLLRTGAYDPEEQAVARHQARKKAREGGDEAGATAASSSSSLSMVEKARQRYQRAKDTAGDSREMPFERLVSCSDDFTLFLWYATVDKKPVMRMTGHVQAVTHISFSPDGRFLASASFDKKLKLWDGRSGRFLHTLNGHVGRVYQVCWASDSRMLASASKDSSIKVWEARDPLKAKGTLAGHADEVFALDWSPNGEMLASGSKDRLVKIWKP